MCIVWLEAAPSCGDPRVIGHFYLNTVETLGGCPITLRFDRSTKNRHIEQFQKFLRRNNTSQRPSYLYGTSPSNQKIMVEYSTKTFYPILVGPILSI